MKVIRVPKTVIKSNISPNCGNCGGTGCNQKQCNGDMCPYGVCESCRSTTIDNWPEVVDFCRQGYELMPVDANDEYYYLKLNR